MSEFDDLKIQGHKIVDWLFNYFTTVEKLSVMSHLNPGEVRDRIPKLPPQKGEQFETIFEDFEKYIIPGITHWQSPGFNAFFPANNSVPSVLGEFLTAGMGVQGMKWITSPAATELEQVVTDWLKNILSLPEYFEGVIMDTASVSTLCAIVAARERISEYKINESGFERLRLRVYCSSEAHSSIEKAVRIAGIGSRNLVKIPVDDNYRMDTDYLENAIKNDLNVGYIPTCIISALGTTGTGAVDDIERIGQFASRYQIWHHVDAAFAGSALILPEVRENIKGIELADSFVFNPHKWLFTNFDCSVFYVRDKELLTNAFSLVPPYLQTDQKSDDLDYSNWGIQLGRRFRSLKLWFVIRYYGVEGLRKKLHNHISYAQKFEQIIIASNKFELLTPRNFNIVCFRFNPGKDLSFNKINELNKLLVQNINNSGKIFLSHTILSGNFAIRYVCGQTYIEEKHIDIAWETISNEAEKLI